MFVALRSFGFLAVCFSACASPTPTVAGHIEGEHVQMTPLKTARIVAIKVHCGIPHAPSYDRKRR